MTKDRCQDQENPTCIDLKTWEDFKAKIDEINQTISSSSYGKYSDNYTPKFRGQANEDWKLEPSLYRELKANDLPTEISISDYYRFLFIPSLQQLNEPLELNIKSSDFITRIDQDDLWQDRLKKFTKTIRKNINYDLPYFKEMTILRHYDLISPLLDWTASPYIAAYFAFSTTPSNPNNKVAIFYYQHTLGSGHSFSSDHPKIINKEYNKTHERHIRQQSSFTYSIKLKDNSNMQKSVGPMVFCSHEKAFENRVIVTENNQYDQLKKYTLPASERIKALKDLKTMNLLDFSLFDTKEAMVKSVSNSVFLENLDRLKSSPNA